MPWWTHIQEALVECSVKCAIPVRIRLRSRSNKNTHCLCTTYLLCIAILYRPLCCIRRPVNISERKLQGKSLKKWYIFLYEVQKMACRGPRKITSHRPFPFSPRQRGSRRPVCTWPLCTPPFVRLNLGTSRW